MKNIFIALIIIITAISACNSPKPTTGNSTDSTATNNGSRDTSASTKSDTSMHR